MQKQNPFINSLLFPIVFLTIMWGVFYFEVHQQISLSNLGVIPRTVFGLLGILFMPLLHGDIAHITSNSLPLLVLTTLLIYFYKEISVKVGVLIYLFTGLLVWLFADLDGTKGVHVGASGLIYGLTGFLFVSGIIRKNKALFGVSLLVTFLYGTIIWGVLPMEVQMALRISTVYKNISWEGHLFGFVTGVVFAFVYRKQGLQQPLYSWDVNNDADVDESNPYWMTDEITEVEEVEQPKPLNDQIFVNYDFKPLKKKENE